MLPDFSTFSENEKNAWLHDNATNIKQGNYFRKFSQDELESKKDSLVDTCIDIDHKEEEFSEIKKTYSDELKGMKKNRAELTTSIKLKGEDTNGVLFEFADHELNMMITLDDSGEEVTRRRLRPDEKQGKLFIQQTKSA